jgi:hypothetical protein
VCIEFQVFLQLEGSVSVVLKLPGCHEQILLGSARNLCGHSRLCGVLSVERLCLSFLARYSLQGTNI